MPLLPGHGPGRACVNERARRLRRRLRTSLLARHGLQATTLAIELRLTLAANFLAADEPAKAATQLECAERGAQMVARATNRQENRQLARAVPHDTAIERLARLQAAKHAREAGNAK